MNRFPKINAVKLMWCMYNLLYFDVTLHWVKKIFITSCCQYLYRTTPPALWPILHKNLPHGLESKNPQAAPSDLFILRPNTTVDKFCSL